MLCPLICTSSDQRANTYLLVFRSVNVEPTVVDGRSEVDLREHEFSCADHPVVARRVPIVNEEDEVVSDERLVGGNWDLEGLIPHRIQCLFLRAIIHNTVY